MKKPNESKTDEKLLEDYLAGDASGFRALLFRYEKSLINYLMMVLRDRHSAEDLFQEVFLSVHKSLARFDLSKKFKPWVYAIASNLAKDELKKRTGLAKQVLDQGMEEEASVAGFLESPELEAGEILNNAEQIARVREILKELPLQQREVLALYYYDDLKYREIADVLSIPMGTVKSRLFAALENLTREFEKRFGTRNTEIRK